MRKGAIVGIALSAAFAAGAQARPTVNTYADQDQFGDAATLGSGFTATVQTGGIRAATNGSRFFNIQGPGSSFSSWGALRFDMTELYAFLDGQVGGGVTGWSITGVTMSLTQSNSSFSAAGTLEAFHSLDDSTDIDPYTAAGTLGNGTGVYAGELGATSFAGGFLWSPVSSGTVDTFDVSSFDVLNDINDTLDSFLTFVLSSPDPSAAITLKGQDSPFAGANAPYLSVSYTLIPTPGAAALLGIGGLVAVRRRRD